MRSVYAVALSSAGTLVAAGTTESFIRLLDPRTGQKVMKLKVGCQKEWICVPCGSVMLCC
jgi:glucose dehydrogenase